MLPIEAMAYLSAILIVLILPGHPVHMLFLGYWLTLGAASSHSGYEAIWAKNRQALLLGAFSINCITAIMSAITATRKCLGTSGSEPFMMDPKKRPAARGTGNGQCTAE